jgi:hypothetical protein
MKTKVMKDRFITFVDLKNLGYYKKNGWKEVTEEEVVTEINSPYQDLTKAQLIEVAKEKGVAIYGKKEDILNRILKVDEKTVVKPVTNKGFSDSLIR